MDEKALHFNFKNKAELINLDEVIIQRLIDNGITHLGYLLHITNEDILRFRRFGKSSLKKLEKFLDEIGFLRETDIYGWVHDNKIEEEAYDIIQFLILNKKKLSYTVPYQDVLDQKKKELNFQLEQKNNFVSNYNLKKFAEDFKLYFSKSGSFSKEGKIFAYRFLKNYSLQQLGDDYDVTRERIRQIIEKNKRKFKNSCTHKNLYLKDYLFYIKGEIWEILVKDQIDKNRILCSDIKKSLYIYENSNKNGLLDLLIFIYFKNLYYYLRENCVLKNDYFYFE